jgi:hypothetical protein
MASFNYYAIIPHPSEMRALLLNTTGGWTLPAFAPADYFVSEVEQVNRAIGETFGLRTSVLRCMYDDMFSDVWFGSRVYALDNLSPEWKPPRGSAWLSYDALHRLHFAEPLLQAVLEEWFAWVQSDDPLRVAWAKQGWRVSAEAWIQQQLAQQNLKLTGAIEQVRARARSCVLRVPTSDGLIYFKAVPSAFAYEPVLTRVLNQLRPGSTPTVLAIDVGRAWMLTRDFGTPAPLVDLSKWQTALKQYAQIQIEMTDRVSSLLAIGCPNRNLDQLVSQIESLLRDDIALFTGTYAELRSDEAAQLAASMPTIQDMCYDLLDFNLPQTLEHGNLVTKNLIEREEGYLYFDWSDSSVTHPFFDLLDILHESAMFQRDVRQALIQAYLEPWTDYAPMERLLRAVELALPLAALHRALVYHRVVLPNIEPRARWEVENWLPHYLHMLLDMMRGDSVHSSASW